MSDSNLTIKCPKCLTSISIDEVLAGEIEEKNRLKFEAEKKKIEEESAAKLEIEKKKLWVIAQEKANEKAVGDRRKAEEELEGERRKAKALEQEIEDQRKKLAEAQEFELKLRQERNKLEEEKKSFELEIQRTIDAERAKIKEEAGKAVLDEYRLKDAEKDKLVSDMRRQIEDLKRKAEQGSQQTQGEVLELELEEAIKAEFPIDTVEPVPKGINGADIIQKVHDQQGRFCGTIAWESKRTKAWTEGWVQKLKDDQRTIKAEIAILVSLVLPSNVNHVGYYEGIYVVTPEAALGLARVLRHQIMKLASARALEEGKSEKKEVIYNYLCGPEFRGRVEAIVEASVAMKEVLDKEKRAFTKIWAEREKQIDRIESNMIGMYGDMQGIAGRALPQIKSLELESGEEELEAIMTETIVEIQEAKAESEPIVKPGVVVETVVIEDADSSDSGVAQSLGI